MLYIHPAGCHPRPVSKSQLSDKVGTGDVTGTKNYVSTYIIHQLKSIFLRRYHTSVRGNLSLPAQPRLTGSTAPNLGGGWGERLLELKLNEMDRGPSSWGKEREWSGAGRGASCDCQQGMKEQTRQD